MLTVAALTFLLIFSCQGPKYDKNDDSDGSSLSSADDEHDDQLNFAVSEPKRQESFNDLSKLSRGLQKRADSMTKFSGNVPNEFDSDSDSDDDSSDGDSIHNDSEDEQELDRSRPDSLAPGDDSGSRTSKTLRRRSSRDRFANKVLGRLYESRAFTSGLVFSRGHFLGDVSKMVAGLLSKKDTIDGSSAQFGFADKQDSTISGPPSVAHQNDDDNAIHSSTLAAGKDGCVVLAFPKSSLIPFMDEHPGLLLSLLGTQVVV